MKPRAIDGPAAQAAAVDLLLRRFRGLAVDNAAPAVLQTPSTGRGGPIETTLLVASSEASAAMKRVADYVCDGTADDVEINAALTALAGASGGVVQLTEGTYSLAASVQVGGSCSLRGAGLWATYLESEASGSGDLLACSGSWGFVSDLSVYCLHAGYEFAVHTGITSDQSSITRVGGLMTADGCDLYGAFYIGNNVNASDLWVPSTNKGYGIYGYGTDPYRITDCVVEGASSIGNGLDVGIYLSGNAGNVAIGNYCATGCYTGIIVSGDDSIVVGNWAANGITIGSGSDRTIIGLNYGTVTDNGTATIGVVTTPQPKASLSVSSAAETTISTVSTAVKAAGTTTLITGAVAFTMPASNRLTYTGAVTRTFEVAAALSMTAAADAKDWVWSLAKNGTVIATSKIGIHSPTGANEMAVSVRSLVSLATNDYIEVWVENATDAANVTMTRLVLTAAEA